MSADPAGSVTLVVISNGHHRDVCLGCEALAAPGLVHRAACQWSVRLNGGSTPEPDSALAANAPSSEGSS